MAQKFEWRLPPGERAPAIAREHVLAALDDRDLARSRSLVNDCLVVVSELVTNAVRAGASVIKVRVVHRTEAVMLEVQDDANGWPVMRAPDPHATTGRGLVLLDALAASWGVRAAVRGKSVWAEVAL